MYSVSVTPEDPSLPSWLWRVVNFDSILDMKNWVDQSRSTLTTSKHQTIRWWSSEMAPQYLTLKRWARRTWRAPCLQGRLRRGVVSLSPEGARAGSCCRTGAAPEKGGDTAPLSYPPKPCPPATTGAHCCENNERESDRNCVTDKLTPLKCEKLKCKKITGLKILKSSSNFEKKICYRLLSYDFCVDTFYTT